jgi:hypothetical protein
MPPWVSQRTLKEKGGEEAYINEYRLSVQIEQPEQEQ